LRKAAERIPKPEEELMSVLTVAELKNGSLKKISRELLAIARTLGGPVTTVLINGTDDDAKALLSSGADVVVKHPLAEYSPEGYARVVAAIAAECDAKTVLLPHTMQGKDFAGRVAVKLKAPIIADVVEVKGDSGSIEVKKPIYSGKAYSHLRVSLPAVLTVRPNSAEPITHSGSDTINSSSVSADGKTTPLRDIDASGASEVQLTDASIVVSGGRGIKGPENWPLLKELCAVLGAALGASRAAVDAGWIDHSHQVGQTGKTVSPNCYIACGISGAIQHLAGMGSSKYIVALNNDPEAPIFKVATYGIVGDLFEVVPPLTEELKKLVGQ